MTDTPWFIRPGQPIIKEELFDADVMEALLRDTAFSEKDRRALSTYKRGREHGNRVKVTYEFGRGCEAAQVGRLYVRGCGGLQAFPFDMRNPLLERFYWDCDMENCHYWLLLHIGRAMKQPVASIDQYCKNRDAELARVSADRCTAKTAFLKTAYGGSVKELNDDWGMRLEDVAPEGDLTLLTAIASELATIRDLVWARHPELQKIAKAKKKPNAKNSVLALYLQSEERKCLLTMERYLESKGRRADVLIHDGCCIRRAEGEAALPEALLRGAEAAIKEATGYEMRLAVKKWQHAFKAPEAAAELIDDEAAARKFIELCGPFIKRDCERVYYFDEALGLWSADDTAFRRAVQKHKARLIFRTMTPAGELVQNYGGVEKNVQAMSKWIAACLEDNKFLSRGADTAIGKLLFADGILDFDKGFTEGFDPAIVFTKRIDRPYPKKCVQALVDEVKQTLFVDAFDDGKGGAAAGMYLLKGITMGMYGDYYRKKLYLALGEADCGKGLTVGALREAFGDYVDEFSANELLYNARNSQDEARRLAWLKPLAGVRIAFSNELRMDGRAADGNLIKGAASGGDEHKVRNNYENAGTLVNRTTLFVMANDFTRITPNPAEDTGLQERLRFIRYQLRFVDSPGEGEKKKDPAAKQKFRTAEYKDAFVHLLLQTYKAMAADEKKINGDLQTPPCVLAETADWVGESPDAFGSVVLERFEVTHDPTDSVSCKAVIGLVGEKGIRMSANKIGRSMRALLKGTKVAGVEALPEPVRAIGNVKHYLGLRVRGSEIV